MSCSNNSCNGSTQVIPPYTCPGRVCIEVNRVFDACISQLKLPATVFTVDFPSTVSDFVSIVNTGNGTLTNVSITPITGSVCSRVSYILTIPVTITATTTAGATVTSASTLTLTRDIILKAPSEGTIPTEVSVVVSLTGGNATAISATSITLDCCVRIVTKITALVDLLIPSYGYPALCECNNYEDDVCSGEFATPLYPR